MKLKKIIAGVSAAALLAATCAGFSVSAADSYTAFLMYADYEWLWGNWQPHTSSNDQGYGVDAQISKDGTYTVSITKDSIQGNDNGENEQWGHGESAFGAVVFCVDIPGLLKTETFNEAKEKEKGVTENGKYTDKEITAKLESIKIDGNDLAFDADKILYGNIEDDNTSYRIEIYNDYGETKNTKPVDTDSIEIFESLDVTFSISGLGSGETAEATTTAAAAGTGGETTTPSADTGATTGLALVGIALAGGAIVLTKKRK